MYTRVTIENGTFGSLLTKGRQLYLLILYEPSVLKQCNFEQIIRIKEKILILCPQTCLVRLSKKRKYKHIENAIL